MEDEKPQSRIVMKREGSDGGGLLGKGRYKVWALGAILSLVFWSMLTVSVTLKWTTGKHTSIHNHECPMQGFNEVLKERERFVRSLWYIYTDSSTCCLPWFWQKAFDAAYDHLTGDDVGLKDAAISEIAKMSLRSVDVEMFSVLPENTREGRNISKQDAHD